MLSYQHLYHAGNLADLHKHALLAIALDYLAQKDKPLSYIETHAGRGVYDLDAPEALKTGEAAVGILRHEAWFAPEHPLARALALTRRKWGESAYPGSPEIAARLLRPTDRLALAELHPQEGAALEEAMQGRPNVTLHFRDGAETALALTPPTPRRGLMLVDPSYEVKSDYLGMAKLLAQVHRKWNVGALLLWYPLLEAGLHRPMLEALRAVSPDLFVHEVRFPPARPGHGMTGSGIAAINPPFGMLAEAERLTALFTRL